MFGTRNDRPAGETRRWIYACFGVFEKVYRFTPFSQDAQPLLRGI
jgi:hypothetical protein